MTAFLFIASDKDARLARRVDFRNIASLFVEADVPQRTGRRRQAARIAAMLVLLLLTVGDTVLIARPDAIGWCFARQGHPGPDRTVTL